MRNEMRRVRHADQIRFCGSLPRSMRRYEMRRQRQYFARVTLREYEQERDDMAQENARLDALFAEEMNNAILMADYLAQQDEYYPDAPDSWPDDGSDYMDDWFPQPDYGDYAQLGCRCRVCRPDLFVHARYAEPVQYGDVTFRRRLPDPVDYPDDFPESYYRMPQDERMTLAEWASRKRT